MRISRLVKNSILVPWKMAGYALIISASAAGFIWGAVYLYLTDPDGDRKRGCPP